MPRSNAAVPGRIFISYRRQETAYPAGWLYDRLAAHFGREQIFKDIDSIALGDDFADVIANAVGSCDVLLALVGQQWLTITDDEGKRRLDNPEDFIRLEIEAALARNIRVIPILVDGARMPRADELPVSVAKLVRRQALEVSPSRFEFDTGKLLTVLEATLAEEQARWRAVEAPATLVLSSRELDFGSLVLSGMPARQRMRWDNVGAGPMDIFTTTSADWLQASHEGNDIVVTVRPDQIGARQGQVVVDSPGGQQILHVKARVTAPPYPTVTPSGKAQSTPDILPASSSGGTSAWAPVSSRPARRPAHRFRSRLVGVSILGLVLAVVVGVIVALRPNNKANIAAQTPKLNLVKDAARSADRIRLTESVRGQAGAAWTATKVDVEHPFTATFRFQIIRPHKRGADGLAFVVQNDGPLSIGVNGLGYGGGIGYDGLRDSLAIEFDTSQQRPPNFPMRKSSDPDGNHISVHSRGQEPNSADEAYSLKRTSAIPDLSDGQIYTARIRYTSGRLSVYLDDLSHPVLAMKIDIAQLLGLADGKAWVGLTAATGGLAEEHDVWPLEWQSNY